MWLRDYHLDGLRLDAVHALEDRRALHLLEQLAAEVQALAARLNRRARADRRVRPQRPAAGHLAGGGRVRPDRAVERRLPPRGARGDHRRAAGLLLRLRLDGRAGQDADPGVLPRRHAGRRSAAGPTAGRWTSSGSPPTGSSCYLQNHDQVGNRADRATGSPPSCRADLVKAGAGLVLTAPFTPMLFMGEEWGADTPWQYFTDHADPGLAGRWREGGGRSSPGRLGRRRRARPAGQGDLRALQAGLVPARPGAVPRLLAWYRALIALRRARPELTDPRLDRVRAELRRAGPLAGGAPRPPAHRRQPGPVPAAPAAGRTGHRGTRRLLPRHHPGRRHRGHAPRQLRRHRGLTGVHPGRMTFAGGVVDYRGAGTS